MGAEFQAELPELRQHDQSEPEEEAELREDLMWTNEILVDDETNGGTVDESQLQPYLDLICKSSVVFGSSNNLELGLHILSYYKGNVKRALKAFLDDSIDLPVGHPITTYKYSGKLFKILFYK